MPGAARARVARGLAGERERSSSRTSCARAPATTACILVGTDERARGGRGSTPTPSDADLTAIVVADRDGAPAAASLRTRADAIAMRMQAADDSSSSSSASRHENDMLISIGRALSQERDIESLLAIILRRACEVTGADAGSVYIVEGHDEDVAKRTLRFTVSQNDSRTLPAGRVHDAGVGVVDRRHVRAVGRSHQRPRPLRARRARRRQQPVGLRPRPQFDDKYRYQTRSMLTVPMISARDEVIGVIQLINKRAKGWIQLDLPSDFDDGVVPFDDVSEAYVVVARVAGRHRARERAALRGGQDAVRGLREGRGHRDRVARSDDVRSLRARRRAHRRARASGRPRRERATTATSGSRRDDLTQIEYAALLHDFGKVGVREHVLVKAKKLYEHERELILQRFELHQARLEVEGLEPRSAT